MGFCHVLPRRVRSTPRDSYEYLDWRPFAYNAGGVLAIKERAKNATDPAVLAKHGNGDDFPLYYSDLAENGNYLEPEEISVRKEVCGDPRLVSTLFYLKPPRFFCRLWCTARALEFPSMYVCEGPADEGHYLEGKLFVNRVATQKACGISPIPVVLADTSCH